MIQKFKNMNSNTFRNVSLLRSLLGHCILVKMWVKCCVFKMPYNKFLIAYV